MPNERSWTELTNLDQILQTYEIYKDCMFLPSKEKFRKKVDSFLRDDSVKIFAYMNHGSIEGIIVLSFLAQGQTEIVGIATDSSVREQGIGSYLIRQTSKICPNLSARTDSDAVGFYRKNGFQITELSEVYDGETVVRYQCEFTSKIS